MALSDIFNPSFFLILGIVMLLLGLLVMYFESKLRDQNHKISSMVSLVSAMAEEMNMVKSRQQINHSHGMPPPLNSLFSMNSMNTINSDSLIHVSDDEDDEDDEDDDDDEDEDEDDEDDDNSEKTSYNGVKKFSENEVINIGEDEKIKIFHFKNENEEEDLEEEDIEGLDDGDFFEETNNILNDLEEVSEDIVNLKERSNLDFLKTIHISNLEEEGDVSLNSNSLDYKKLSLNKLRNVVIEKGLTTDSSKLKKNELLKLLGVE